MYFRLLRDQWHKESLTLTHVPPMAGRVSHSVTHVPPMAGWGLRIPDICSQVEKVCLQCLLGAAAGLDWDTSVTLSFGRMVLPFQMLLSNIVGWDYYWTQCAYICTVTAIAICSESLVGRRCPAKILSWLVQEKCSQCPLNSCGMLCCH